MLVGNMCSIDSNCVFNNPYKNNIDMTQYISKSALIAEIEERRDSLISLSESCPTNTVAKSGFYAQAQSLEGIKNFIDTLKVKEVDLDKEIKKTQRKYKTIEEYEGYPATIYSNDIECIAKHFFELGLKAQKGENYD